MRVAVGMCGCGRTSGGAGGVVALPAQGMRVEARKGPARGRQRPHPPVRARVRVRLCVRVCTCV